MAALTILWSLEIEDDLRFIDLGVSSHGAFFWRIFTISLFEYNSLTLTSITISISEGITLCCDPAFIWVIVNLTGPRKLETFSNLNFYIY